MTPEPRLDYLNFKQAADAFPGALNPNTMRCWLKRGSHGFPDIVSRIGSSLRIRRDHLEAFIDGKR
ncbi:helix-turn-helix domain-containing protein [Quatrionicoccus australiensis]|uniref:helix-turn-helix domain-containing protein n=1 Tax=Quatrionicoccus australiensis TaxID=138118 RepID=UPI001CF8ABE2|nr:helix-turn-helix domain-containing protein [Quatrionicoccus australiensis]UCV14121.1 helix-turn-helix domain-containing protein [Quatrionicoccus australiensis]